MTRRIAAEDSLQIFTKDLLDRFAIPDLIYFHVPNESKRSKADGAFQKRKGMRPGVSDWVLAKPPNARMYVLELKAGKKKPTAEQLQFFDDVLAAGGVFSVARTPEKVTETLLAWGMIRDPKL